MLGVVRLSPPLRFCMWSLMIISKLVLQIALILVTLFNSLPVYFLPMLYLHHWIYLVQK